MHIEERGREKRERLWTEKEEKKQSTVDETKRDEINKRQIEKAKKSVVFEIHFVSKIGIRRKQQAIYIINNNREMEGGHGLVLCCDYSNCINS